MCLRALKRNTSSTIEMPASLRSMVFGFIPEWRSDSLRNMRSALPESHSRDYLEETTARGQSSEALATRLWKSVGQAHETRWSEEAATVITIEQVFSRSEENLLE
jgi:hypothetical protein